MAQNITLLGASYSAVPAVVLPKTGGGTARFDDASVTTATASDVASGKVFLASDGTITEGTNSGGGSGGDSAWTKVAETSYQVNTTSNTSLLWSTGHSEIWTSDKIVYVRIRDTAGKRAGYFYGSDNFLVNVVPPLGTSRSTATMVHCAIKYTSGSKYEVVAPNGQTGYGVFAETLYSDGRIRVRARYSSSYSLTINGTYKVEVYLLDPADGVPILN